MKELPSESTGSSKRAVIDLNDEDEEASPKLEEDGGNVGRKRWARPSAAADSGLNGEEKKGMDLFRDTELPSKNNNAFPAFNEDKSDYTYSQATMMQQPSPVKGLGAKTAENFAKGLEFPSTPAGIPTKTMGDLALENQTSADPIVPGFKVSTALGNFV